MLTNISLPGNAGIASCTNDVPGGTCSRRRLRRELQLGSDECNFQQIDYTSLATSASLLSSVIAFEMLTVIISEIIHMSSPNSQLFSATPPHFIQRL